MFWFLVFVFWLVSCLVLWMFVYVGASVEKEHNKKY